MSQLNLAGPKSGDTGADIADAYKKKGGWKWFRI